MRICTRITLHGGPKKWQKRGRPLRVLLRFCFLNFSVLINFEDCFYVPLSTSFSFREFFLFFRLFLFTVHVRPVLSPCQAGFCTIITHHAHNTLFLQYTLCIFLAPFRITGFCLTTFVIFNYLRYIFHSVNWYIMYIYIYNACFDLQIKFCFMLYIVSIA